jgi:uncharacterized protein YjbI with pentapeptide repeats
VTLGLVISLFGGYLFGWDWTGLVKDANFPKRTLWDWLQLLVIPAVIAGGGIWFNRRQQQREAELEERRSQDAALQSYLDQMSQLLLDRSLGSPVENGEGKKEEKKRGEARVLALARTLAVLRRLDSEGKSSVALFLIEASVIQGSVQEFESEPAIPLFEANLVGTNLNNTNLVGVDLHDVKLAVADLSGADLRSAKLYSAYEGTDLSGANLSNASLSDANLTRAVLKNADLNRADLSRAELSGSDLNGANLDGAQVTEEQLSSCASLKGATMPSGLKYEHWLKTPEGQTWLKNEERRGENGA